MIKNPKPRYLTKSRYKMAIECPTKLFYTGKPEVYADSKLDDGFLKSLAKGGFQVGALTQSYYPEGVEITSTDHDESVAQTDNLLSENENITIFEAALKWENLFIRVDILIKKGNQLELIEVKSKSFDHREENIFFDKNALKKKIYKLNSEFAPYLYDVAFQTFVCRKAYPSLSVSSFLMMPDKATVTSVDHLNQFFLLKQMDKNRSIVITKPGLTKEDLGDPILKAVKVDDVVELIHASKNTERNFESDRCQGLPYEKEILYLAKMYVTDQKINIQPGSHCKGCEFRATHEQSHKNGFNECWQSEKHLNDQQILDPFVFDLWNFKGSQKLIDKDIFFINQITKDNFEIKESKVDEDGLSMTERQWTQIEWNQKGRHDPYIDKDALKGEFSSWKFPLHFIDFETTMVAIPFNKGRRPYEQVAFQFSHHVVYEDGRIEHADQYLNKHRGIFPNFDFVRSLKRVLEKDRGTIFSYAPHENTVLCQIREQLKQSKETDAQDLIAWIETITKAGEKSVDQWCGDRVMVDLCKMVKKYFYHPLTKGSNSIKKVLPAILNTSDLLKERYSKPTYGTPDGIKSLNHKSLTLIEYDSQGNVKDPYKQLPPIYQGLGHELNFIFGEDELADGGAAMTAYAMMQFTEMSDIERDALASALLKYCELDTFAMVLLYEYWKGCLDKDRVFQAA